jgi:hypothetical protein
MKRHAIRLVPLFLCLVALVLFWTKLIGKYQCVFGNPPRSKSSPEALLVALRTAIDDEDRAKLFGLYVASSQDSLSKLDSALGELAQVQVDLVRLLRDSSREEEASLLDRCHLDGDSIFRFNDIASMKLDYRDGDFFVANVSVETSTDSQSALVHLVSVSSPLWLVRRENEWELVPGRLQPDIDSIPVSIDRLTTTAQSLANDYRDIAQSLRGPDGESEIVYREMMFATLLRANSIERSSPPSGE